MHVALALSGHCYVAPGLGMIGTANGLGLGGKGGGAAQIDTGTFVAGFNIAEVKSSSAAAASRGQSMPVLGSGV